MQTFGGMGQMPATGSQMTNPMIFNPLLMNPVMNPLMNPMMNPIQQQNFQRMQQAMNPQVGSPAQQNMRMARIQKEFNLCSNDNDLIQIGCSFGIPNNNYNVWKVTMVGPSNTPYQGGIFYINVYFPDDYPKKGAEFRFTNKIYHLNVDWKNKKTYGHICLSSLNEWATTGKVKGKPCYGVKQALFDIFCLFYNQGTESPYDEAIAKQYRDNRAEFDATAKEWTAKYGK